jgi:hypothetical protein
VLSWLLRFSRSAAEGMAVGVGCVGVGAAASVAVAADSVVGEADFVAAAHLAVDFETVASETVVSAEAFEAASTAALDSVDDLGPFRFTDFTAATDITIPSSTILPRTIPIPILIRMRVGTHLPGTVLAHLA